MARMSAFLIVGAFIPVDAYSAPKGTVPYRAAEQAKAFAPEAAQVHRADRYMKQEQSPVNSSWNPLILGLVMGLFAAAVGGRAPAALAADEGNGEAVFAANCASCHAGGANTIAPDKKLNKEKLQQYGKYEINALVSQVAKGNGSMPAFGAKLSPDDVQDVAAYVRAQADKGW